MKYLIPTNFSKESNTAIVLATTLAKNNDAELHILHCQECKNVVVDRSHSTYSKPNFDAYRDEEIKIQLRELRNSIEQKGIKCYVYNECKDYEHCMTEYANNLKPDLVIIGAKGYEKTSDWIFGSTSKNIAKTIDAKTIIIDEEIIKINFGNVLFLLEDDLVKEEEMLEPFDWLCSMGLEKLDVACNEQCSVFCTSLINTIRTSTPNVICEAIIVSDKDDFENTIYKLMKENNYGLVAMKISDKPTFFSKINIHDILSHSKQTAFISM